MLFDAFGGALIALIGAASLFMLDSVTFVVATLSFVDVRLPAREDSVEEASKIDVAEYIADFTEGVKCLHGSVFVETTFTSAVVNLGVGMMLAVLPAFAEVRSGPALYGTMLGVLGIRSAAGAALASKLANVKYVRIRIIGDALSCILWLGAVYTPWSLLVVGLFALAWISAGIAGVMGNTLEQVVTPNHLLGRVSSVTASASTLTLPIGALLGGVVGSTIRTLNMMAAAGLTLGFVSFSYAVQPQLRRLPAMTDINPEEFNVDLDSPPESEESDGDSRARHG